MKQVRRIIAYCGMNCAECEAYIAFKKDDDELRSKTAEKWTSMFEKSFTPEDINCAGCINTDGVHVEFCNICEIRKCGQNREVVNCAHCDEYPCQKLLDFFPKVAPGAKDTLDEIRTKLNI